MPVSLNNSESGIEVESTAVNRKSKKLTTSTMVDDALIALHSAKGLTLKSLYKYVLENYEMESVSKSRIILIKKHILQLRESGDIVNKTGKGFTGHLKLADKKAYMKKLKENAKQQTIMKATKKSTSKVEKPSNVTVRKQQPPSKANKTSATIGNKPKNSQTKKIKAIAQLPQPVVPRQTTPVRINSRNPPNTSMFDTPIIQATSQIHASTPFIHTQNVPHAPVVGKTKRKRALLNKDIGNVTDTPRSSLGKKRRI